MRWKVSGILDIGNGYNIICSAAKGGQYGTGFIISSECKSAIMDFKPVNERIVTVRVRGKFGNISICSVHAPIEDEEGEEKDIFYAQLQRVIDDMPTHDVKMIMGDFNAKVGTEEYYASIIGKHSLHQISNDNGKRIIDLASSNSMVISSTRFPHKRIHKETWVSPDGETRNQIDHIMIDSRHMSDILDVRSYRGADCDSDHFLVGVRFKERISVKKEGGGVKNQKFNLEKLRKDEEMVAKYRKEVSENVKNKVKTETTVEEDWEEIKDILLSASETLGRRKRENKNKGWYDEECRLGIKERNQARLTLLNEANEENKEIYKTKKEKVKKLCRKKKREYEQQRLTEIEDMAKAKSTRKFYGEVGAQKKGFQPRVQFCRDSEGELVGDKQKIIKRWKEYFERLLNIGGEEETLNRQELAVGQQEEENVETPTEGEVREIIRNQKNNKAPGEDEIAAEMLKFAGNEMESNMHKLIKKIWEKEEMPKAWNTAVICPLHKKGDKTVCENYRGIALLSIGYKILSTTIVSRITPIMEQIAGDYQCGFRRGRSTLDQIFIIRQIMEKSYEKDLDLFYLFIDFRQAYDSVKRPQLYEILNMLHVPPKLIRLIKLCLKDSQAKVKVQGNLSESFEIKEGLRQGDPLSTSLFNLILEWIIRQVKAVRKGTILNRTTQILAYADDLVIISRNKSELQEVFIQLEEAAKKVGLSINQNKSKFMITARGGREEHDLVINQNVFEKIGSFRYLGAVVTEKNILQDDIETRISAGNRCFYALRQVFQSKAISRKSKLTVYKTVVRPVVMYGAEAWTLNKKEESALLTWERKILRRIYGPVTEDGAWRIRYNFELKQLYNQPSIVNIIKSNRVGWLGHLDRMDASRGCKIILKGDFEGKRPKGRPRKRWLDNVVNDIEKAGVRNWRHLTKDRKKWREVKEKVSKADDQA